MEVFRLQLDQGHRYAQYQVERNLHVHHMAMVVMVDLEEAMVQMLFRTIENKLEEVDLMVEMVLVLVNIEIHMTQLEDQVKGLLLEHGDLHLEHYK